MLNGTEQLFLWIAYSVIATLCLYVGYVYVIKLRQKRAGIEKADRKQVSGLVLVISSFVTFLIFCTVLISSDGRNTRTEISTQLRAEKFTVLDIDYKTFGGYKVVISKDGVINRCTAVDADKWRLIDCQQTLNK